MQPLWSIPTVAYSLHFRFSVCSVQRIFSARRGNILAFLYLVLSSLYSSWKPFFVFALWFHFLLRRATRRATKKWWKSFLVAPAQWEKIIFIFLFRRWDFFLVEAFNLNLTCPSHCSRMYFFSPFQHEKQSNKYKYSTVIGRTVLLVLSFELIVINSLCLFSVFRYELCTIKNFLPPLRILSPARFFLL